MKTGPVENHRGREGGALVYPVLSRRSGGLSIGINLFPDRKLCSFDCPYCEVFPFKTDEQFSPAAMETDLIAAVKRSAEQGAVIRDICFSGNGEPTMSPHFPEALETAAHIRDKSVPGAALVLITNGSGLLNKNCFDLLKDAAGYDALKIWLKLDAGTSGWYEKMDRSNIAYHSLIAKIKEFVRLAPVTLQTMLCAIDGKAPPAEETQAWETLVLDLVRTSAGGPGIQGFQLYGKARPAPEDPLAESLPAAYLENRAASLRAALADAGLKKSSGENIPVDVFY
jgi:histidinol dehydrogenase